MKKNPFRYKSFYEMLKELIEKIQCQVGDEHEQIYILYTIHYTIDL